MCNIPKTIATPKPILVAPLPFLVAQLSEENILEVRILHVEIQLGRSILVEEDLVSENLSKKIRTDAGRSPKKTQQRHSIYDIRVRYASSF